MRRLLLEVFAESAFGVLLLRGDGTKDVLADELLRISSSKVIRDYRLTGDFVRNEEDLRTRDRGRYLHGRLRVQREVEIVANSFVVYPCSIDMGELISPFSLGE